MLFICHDLALIRSFAHQIAVMYLGNIVEVIPGEDVTEHAVHPYTQALLGAQFSIHMDPNQKIQSIESEAPSPLDVPKGCPFQNRCENCHDRNDNDKLDNGKSFFIVSHNNSLFV